MESSNLQVEHISKAKPPDKLSFLYNYRVQQVRTDVFLFVMSLILFQLVELLVMFTITMSNERLNLDAPVLYDSILSVIPKQKLAGQLSEILLFSYQIWFIVFMIFHKRRFALARRCLVVQSICFFVRVICIWANILPRSTYTMECSPKATGAEQIIQRVILLWGAAGLSIFGGHMCGNYFFSGHALMATIIYQHLAFYMPARWCVAHKVNVLISVFIAVLILSAHNHYTLDIVGSILVGNWIFKVYTLIAENPEIKSEEWFPVFWRRLAEFFEKDKEKIEYSFGGIYELYHQIKFIINILSTRLQ